MNSEKTNEIGVNDSNGRVLKVSKPGARALKALEQLRATRPMAQEVPDAEVARIAREKFRLHGCGFAVHRVDDGITPFVMSVRGGEIRIRSRLEFLPTLQVINSKNGGLTYGVGP
jgi:hypothetical protein